MSYYGFSASRYLPSINQAYATRGEGIAQLGVALGKATQTVAESVQKQKDAAKLLAQNKELFDKSYNATYRIYEDKLIEIGIPKEQTAEILHKYFTPITSSEYKNPELYIKTKEQEAIRLNNYIDQLRQKQVGGAVQREVSPQWQATGTEQPQQALGQGPIAQAAQEGGRGGFITGETKEGAQTDQELRQRMLGAPEQFTPKEIETGAGMAGLPTHKTLIELEREQRASRVAQEKHEMSQEKHEMSVEKFEQEKKEFETTKKRMAKVEARQSAQMATNYFQKNPTPTVAKARLEKIETKISELTTQIENAKEQKATAVQAQLQGSLDYYNDQKKRAAESLRYAEYMDKFISENPVGASQFGGESTQVNVVEMEDPETGKRYMVNADTNEVLYEVTN